MEGIVVDGTDKTGGIGGGAGVEETGAIFDGMGGVGLISEGDVFGMG